jgi:hypothetical protein
MKEFPNLHALALVCIGVASVSSRASSATSVTVDNAMTYTSSTKTKRRADWLQLLRQAIAPVPLNQRGEIGARVEPQ